MRKRLGTLGFVLVSCLTVPGGGAHAQSSFEDTTHSFVEAVTYPAPAAPFAVATGDFNGDGHPDIAVACQEGNAVSVRLGTGTGAFGAAASFSAGLGPQGMAVRDFNGDGYLDLAVANLFSNDVSILLGTGLGTFRAPKNYASGANPRSVSAGDFNNDGKLDLIVPNGSAPLAILLGSGSGTFGTATTISTGVNPNFAALGDYDGDGNLDAAVTNEGDDTLSILLGMGDGTFTPHATMAVGDQPRSVVASDFNGDGRKDLAIANVGSNDVSVLAGLGDGDFGTATSFAAGVSPTFLVAGDFDADGKPDLAIANETHRLTVLRGLGKGMFGSPASYSAGFGPRWVEAADFNGDGQLDLVSADASGNDVGVLLGEALPALHVAPSQRPHDTSSYALRRAPIWIERQEPLTGLFSHAMYADINRDGHVDFVRTHEANDGVRRPLQVMMGGQGGTFTDETASVITNAQPGLLVTRKILTGEFNGDGWPDFFLINHGVDAPPFSGEYPQLFLSNGDGTLRYAPDFEGAQYTKFNHGGAAADIDGNGTVDLLVANPTQPFFLLNDGSGHFTKNVNRLPTALTGTPFYEAELVDVDADGFIDLLTGAGEPGYASAVYWGSSSGYYRSSSSTVLPPSPQHRCCVLDFAVDDLDRDGRRDIVIDSSGLESPDDVRYLQLLRQTALRTFADQTTSRISMDISLRTFDYFRAQDINDDGAIDLLVDDKSDMVYGEYAWTNNGSGVFKPYAGPVNPSIPRRSKSDFNADGKSDLLWRNQVTGADTIWKSANSALRQSITGVTTLTWSVAAIGDFDGNGTGDIFWRDEATGANTIWKSAMSKTKQSVASADRSWQFAGVGEFDGDGRSDVLWRNRDTGDNAIWRSGNKATPLAMGAVTNLAWKIAGVGDFDGDGVSDVLWRNSATGANTIWISAQFSHKKTVTAVSTSWNVAGVGDFDGDGTADIVWRDGNTGSNVIWKSANKATRVTMSAIKDLAWKAAAIGDYDGDGKSDVMWRHGKSGANVIWRSGNSATPQAVASVSTAWALMP
jgi:hypothetical protein